MFLSYLFLKVDIKINRKKKDWQASLYSKIQRIDARVSVKKQK